MKRGIRLLGLLGCLISGSSVAAPCTHWASADAAGPSRDGSPGSPFTVEEFFVVAEPGSVLCLRDGVYTGSAQMIRPPRGLSGAPGLPITIRAEHDGRVLIDGGSRTSPQSRDVPVLLHDTNHWVIEGINAAHSNLLVVGIAGVQLTPGSVEEYRPIEDVTLRRVVAWDANPCFDRSMACTPNHMVIGISSAKDVLLEDVAAFGTGRKIFQVFQSSHVTIRRAWGRWEGNGGSHVQTFSCGYRSYDVLCENIIGTWTGESQPAGHPVGQRKAILGKDWHTDKDNVWSGRRDPWNVGLRVLGSIAYVEPGARFAPFGAVVFDRVKNATMMDIVSYMNGPAPVGRTFALGDCLLRTIPGETGCQWSVGPGRAQAPLVARRLASIGGDGSPQFDPEWIEAQDQSSILEATVQDRPNVFTGETARLCHRYVDGVLTNEPLWPWPMESRIQHATTLARGLPVSVTDTVERLLGPIPQECMAPPPPAPAAPDPCPGMWQPGDPLRCRAGY